MEIELIAHTPNPEEVIEKCGRTCYKSPEKDAETRAKFIAGIIRSGHTSVIEHASATFRLKGVSRSLTHQLVRHRLFSFSQQSQRYVKEGEPNYVTPPALHVPEVLDSADKTLDPMQVAARKIYDDCMRNCWNTYKTLLELGLKKEDARFVLPNAACTEICVTGNFREWYNFLELRLDVHAQWEIRTLAWAILDKLIGIAPNVFNDLRDKHKDRVIDDLVMKRTVDLINTTTKTAMSDAEVHDINERIKQNTAHDIATVVNSDDDTVRKNLVTDNTPMAEFRRIVNNALSKR